MSTPSLITTPGWAQGYFNGVLKSLLTIAVANPAVCARAVDALCAENLSSHRLPTMTERAARLSNHDAEKNMRLSKRFVISFLYLAIVIPFVAWGYWRYYINDLVNTASMMLMESRYQEAFDNADKAIQYGCNEARCYFIRGYSTLALIELNKLSKASSLKASKSDLNKAMQLSDNDQLKAQCKQFLELITSREKKSLEL